MDKKARKALAEEISISIALVLKKADERAAGKVRKHVSAAAKQLVKRFDRHLPANPGIEKESLVKKSAVKSGKKTALKKTAVKRSAGKKAVRKKAARKVKA